MTKILIKYPINAVEIGTILGKYNRSGVDVRTILDKYVAKFNKT